MKRTGIFILAFMLCFLLAACEENELSYRSNYKPNPLDGISLEATATSKECTYIVSSQIVNYIVFDGFSKNMTLEKLIDNEWYTIIKDKFVIDIVETASPSQSCSNTIKWKDYYKSNLNNGEYRLIVSFWTQHDNANANNYNAITMFSIE